MRSNNARGISRIKTPIQRQRGVTYATRRPRSNALSIQNAASLVEHFQKSEAFPISVSTKPGNSVT